MKKLLTLTNAAASGVAVLFGFGNAARILFTPGYKIGDCLFGVVMMAAIGALGIWMLRTAINEYKAQNR